MHTYVHVLFRYQPYSGVPCVRAIRGPLEAGARGPDGPRERGGHEARIVRASAEDSGKAPEVSSAHYLHSKGMYTSIAVWALLYVYT